MYILLQNVSPDILTTPAVKTVEGGFEWKLPHSEILELIREDVHARFSRPSGYSGIQIHVIHPPLSIYADYPALLSVPFSEHFAETRITKEGGD